MLFLLRLAFWVLLICLLLPGSHDDNRRLINSAERTVSDVRGFCQRNPGVCEDARLSLTIMLSRLRSGADYIQTWLAQNAARERPSAAPYPGGPSSGQPPRLVPK